MTSLPSSNINSATNSARASRIGTPNEKLKRNLQFVEKVCHFFYPSSTTTTAHLPLFKTQKFKDRISVQNKDGTRTQMLTGEVYASSTSSSDYIRTTTTHRKESAISKKKGGSEGDASSSSHSTHTSKFGNKFNALTPSDDSSSTDEDDQTPTTKPTKQKQQHHTKPQTTTGVLQNPSTARLAKHGSLQETTPGAMILKKKQSMPSNAGTANNSNNNSKQKLTQDINFDEKNTIQDSKPSKHQKDVGNQKKPNPEATQQSQFSIATSSPGGSTSTEQASPKKHTQYKPFTKKELKEIIENQAKPMGGLGPDLDREKVKEAKKKVDRAKKYANNLLKINRESGDTSIVESEQ